MKLAEFKIIVDETLEKFPNAEILIWDNRKVNREIEVTKVTNKAFTNDVLIHYKDDDKS